MSTKVLVGVQWGDEGKGKIIDILASKADVVVRSQGGNNAGHAVTKGKEVYKLNLIPSGILYPQTLCLIGAGVVMDPQDILREIDDLENRGVSCSALRIDPRAHIIMPWHIALDELSENAKGAAKIGTTKRGIGPCYMDKAERVGIRLCDLMDNDIFISKVKHVAALKNNILEKLYNAPTFNVDNIIEKYIHYANRLKPYVADVSVLTFNACLEGKEILFEGAHGTLLDLDMGTYPFVTSSNPISAGVCVGTGVGPKMIDEIIGVAKAYTTRVGSGPFPTELDDEIGELIRVRGHEFGTTTGRPRRTGWFDSVILRHAVRVNGLTSLVVNKFDTISDIDMLRICTAYRKSDGSIITDFPCSIEELSTCTPVYKDLPGFHGDLSLCKTYSELPVECKNYIAELETLCGCPITMVGVGPSREQNLVVE